MAYLQMPTRGVYAITPSDGRPEALLLKQVEAALKGGIALLQYRDKQASDGRRRRLATALLELCRRYNVPLIINDSAALALAVGAHGVHLGQQDGDVADARRQLGRHALVGVTCHASAELATRAIADGANYVAFGRFFPSITKAEALPANLLVLQQPQPVPVVAIGGVTELNGGILLEHGANVLAVCEAIFTSGNIRDASLSLTKLFS